MPGTILYLLAVYLASAYAAPNGFPGANWKEFPGNLPFCYDHSNESFDDIGKLTEFMRSDTKQTLPIHKQSFCKGNPRMISRRLVSTIDQHEDLVTNWYIGDNALAFKNPPGPISKGMCWLHSRLQRQFTYLANFRPDLPEVSRKDALKAIDDIVHRRGVTEIAGFSNLSAFSAKYREELIDAINSMGWDCVTNPNDCAVRLLDSYSPSANELQETMRQLYERRLAMPGDIQVIRTRLKEKQASASAPFIAHSLLILGMAPLRKNKEPHEVIGQLVGYRLTVVDPNHQQEADIVDYKFGDREIIADGRRIIPYTHYAYDGDIPEMNAHVDAYCKK